MRRLFHHSVWTAALGACVAGGVAWAGEIYGTVGSPGLTLGYSQGLSDSLNLRMDYSTLGSRSKNGWREGIDFSGSAKAKSLGLYLDWFPGASPFRLTGGLNFNDTRAAFSSTANNVTGSINGRPVNLTGEYFNVEVKQPGVTPYVGVGYGFKPDKGKKGLGFVVDAGLMIGRFKTDYSTSMVGKQGITQADVDAEVAKVRDSVRKISVVPKLSVGMSYAF